jgi:hypothetical protein
MLVVTQWLYYAVQKHYAHCYTVVVLCSAKILSSLLHSGCTMQCKNIVLIVTQYRYHLLPGVNTLVRHVNISSFMPVTRVNLRAVYVCIYISIGDKWICINCIDDFEIVIAFVSCIPNIRVMLLKSRLTTRHEGAWGERRYSSYSFLTSALDGGKWSASRLGRALAPGEVLPVPTVQEAGWAPEPVWIQRLEEKSFRLCWGSNPDYPITDCNFIKWMYSVIPSTCNCYVHHII